MIHPQTDMSLFRIFGRILSHAYLVCGDLPIRIALPSLTCMLLGPGVSISRKALLDTFLDYLSVSEREIFKKALEYKGSSFPMQEDLMNTLAIYGCRTLLTPSNYIVGTGCQISKLATELMIYSGIPEIHKNFWKTKSPQQEKLLTGH